MRATSSLCLCSLLLGALIVLTGCGGGSAESAPPEPSLVVSTMALVTSEGGKGASFQVRLGASPQEAVVVTMISGDPSEGTLAPPTLTFDPSNWSSYQAVVVTPVDDADADGDIAYAVTLSASGDAAYATLAPRTVDVVNLDSWGLLSADAVTIDAAALDATSPTLMAATLDCASLTFASGDLTADAQAVLADGTGGSADVDRGLAMELLAASTGADLAKTRSQIGYTDAGGATADFSILVDGRVGGVLVTRAFTYPTSNPYTVPMATTLLQNQLGRGVLAGQNVVAADAWEKTILVILAWDSAAADAVQTAWSALDPATQGDTIVLVVRTDGGDAFVYGL